MEHDVAADEREAIERRGRALGLSYLEQCALEQNEPWYAHWSARHGRGAANMREWLQAGSPRAERDKLCVSGARVAVKLVRELVDRLPEAVAWHLVETTAIAWVVPDLGLTAPWPTPPTRPEGRIDMAFAVSARSVGLVVHEVAHRWHRDPGLFVDLTAAEIEELDEMVRAAPGAAERAERADLTEDAADALASLWIGETVDTSGARAHARRVSLGEDAP